MFHEFSPRWLQLIAILTVLTSAVDANGQGREMSIGASGLTDSGDAIHSGIFVLNGTYVAPPYQVAERDGQLFLNNHPVNLPRTIGGWDISDGEDDDGEGADGGGPERSFRNNRAPGGAGNRWQGGRWPGRRRGAARRFTAARSGANQLRQRLEQGDMLLCWDDGVCSLLSAFEADEVICLLADADESNRDQTVERLEELVLDDVTMTVERWRRLVAEFQPTKPMIDRARESQAALADVREAVAAPHQRRISISYLITVGGIALSVYALGTLLGYRPGGRVSWSQANPAAEAIGLVTRSVLLLVALGALDLVCTTVSSSTAGFWELNPLGAALLASPLVLAGFKITATATSATILLSLRRYHGAQVAAWWLALFCTVLTLRWVTFNSMFLV